MRSVLSGLVLVLASGLNAQAPAGYPEALGLFSQGKYEDSLTKLRAVFEENKGSVHLRLLAAANHSRLGRANDAMAHLIYAIKDHPDDARPMAMLAAIYRKQGQLGEAQVWIGRAIDADGKTSDYKMEAARIFYKSGQYAAARKFIDQILAATPAHQDALALDGLIFLRQGNAENAVFRLGQALKYPGTSKAAMSDVYNNMAVALRKFAEALDKGGNPAEASSRRTEATEMLLKAVELNPDNALAKANKDQT